MSNIRHIFNDGYNSLIRLVKQGVRARLGSIGRAKEDDDAVPLDQLMELLASAGGSSWTSGAGAPSAPASNGELYLNTSNGDVYQYVDPTGWGSPIMNLVGADGTKWFSDFGDPVSAGIVGMIEEDHYLDLFSGDVYKYESGSWGSPYINLTGPSGAPGAPGSRWYSDNGNPNTLGQPFVTTGDYYLDIDNGNYYKSNGSSPNFWVLQGNLTGPEYSDYTIVSGSGSSFSGFASNIELDLSAGSVVLTDCIFLGTGETIVFPNGYTATGKTFISGVSSNFTDSLDLSKGSIYKATGGGSGFGLLIIPANREWVGKFIFLNDYAVIEEITNLSTWIPEIVFQADIPSTFGGFTFYLLDIGSGAVTVDKIVGTALTTDLGKGSRNFDTYGAALNQAGFAVITRQGDFNIYLDGKSIPTY